MMTPLYRKTLLSIVSITAPSHQQQSPQTRTGYTRIRISQMFVKCCKDCILKLIYSISLYFVVKQK